MERFHRAQRRNGAAMPGDHGEEGTARGQARVKNQPHGIGFWLLLGAAALVVIALFEFRGEPGPQPRQSSLVGHRLPQLQLSPLTGTERSIGADDLTGHVTLLDFWGTWCPPCREEIPHIATLAAKYKDAPGFQVLAVSCGGGADREDIGELR